MLTTPNFTDDGTLTMRAGDDLSLVLTYTDDEDDPIDLTDYQAAFRAFGSDETTPVINISTEDESPMIVLGGASGTIEIDIPASTTALITDNGGFYGLKLFDVDGKADTILSGDLIIEPNIVSEEEGA